MVCACAPAGQPLCAAKRRKWCDVPKHLEGQVLSPDHVYTFHIWQHLIDFSSYKLSVGRFVNVDLAAVLNGQPLQLTVIDTKVRVMRSQGARAGCPAACDPHPGVLVTRTANVATGAALGVVACPCSVTHTVCYVAQQVCPTVCVHVPNSLCLAAAVCVPVPVQEKAYLFSMLVWHERLLYGSGMSSEHHTAMQQISERLSNFGASVRSMLSGTSKC